MVGRHEPVEDKNKICTLLIIVVSSENNKELNMKYIVTVKHVLNTNT